MLEREFQYYKDHQEELVGKYNGRVIVIMGEEVVGDYDTYDDAFHASIKKYTPGTFLIQECSPGEESYTQTFHYLSRAIF
jgi:hypothetical protein